MIELLGVGVQDAQKAWLLRKACARFHRGTLSVVVARSPVEGAALIDALTGRRIPDEGRVWVTGVPLMRETRGRVRALVGEATAAAALMLREVDGVLGADGAASLLGMVRRLVRSHRLTAVVSLASIELARRYADRVLLLTAGALAADTSRLEPDLLPRASEPVGSQSWAVADAGSP